jgi:hypothetical protein
MRILLSATGLASLVAIVSIAAAYAMPTVPLRSGTFVAQTAAPSGAGDAGPTEAQKLMLSRFPQPVRVGALIGAPLLDDSARTLGYVRQVVRTPQGAIKLIVAYNDLFGWFGWDTHPVAVPIEVVGIAGRHLSSLDMPRSEFATAPVWKHSDEVALSENDSILVALSRH